MQAANNEQLKEALRELPAKKLIELCLRLARFKKENKELLSFLIFEAHDMSGYIQGINNLIDESFLEIPRPNAYLTKKALRRTLRAINKHHKYAASKTALVEWLLHFCERYKEKGLNKYHPATDKIYAQQLDKVSKLLPAIEEDLQYDYRRQLERLQ